MLVNGGAAARTWRLRRDVDKFERLEQERQDPVDRAPLEQETLQMWKSQLVDDMRRGLKPLRACMAETSRT